MIYGYIRVSTDKQTVENQRFELENWCKAKEMRIDGWVEETISGAKDYKKRKLGGMLKRLKKDDILVCAELSRLGRNLLMVMEILNHCLKNGITIMTSKENYVLGDDINAKVLAFAFGLAAEIERKMICMRTKEALALRRKNGVQLGRRVGAKSATTKLTGKEDKIIALLGQGFSKANVAQKLKVHRATLTKYLIAHSEQFRYLPISCTTNIHWKQLQTGENSRYINSLQKRIAMLYKILNQLKETPQCDICTTGTI